MIIRINGLTSQTLNQFKLRPSLYNQVFSSLASYREAEFTLYDLELQGSIVVSGVECADGESGVSIRVRTKFGMETLAGLLTKEFRDINIY